MKKLIFVLIMTCFSFVFAADIPTPVITLQSISNNMIAGLKKNKASLKRNPQVVYGLVKKNVVPHVDLSYMSKAVLGREAWFSVNAAQQKAFEVAFTNVVIDTYSSALSAYTDEKVEFFPVRGDYKSQSIVHVQSRVIRSDGPPIALYYKVSFVGGRWLIRDLTVEGVSIIQSFRAQFQDLLSKGKSVVQITQDLNAKHKGK